MIFANMMMICIHGLADFIRIAKRCRAFLKNHLKSVSGKTANSWKGGTNHALWAHSGFQSLVEREDLKFRRIISEVFVDIFDERGVVFQFVDISFRGMVEYRN